MFTAGSGKTCQYAALVLDRTSPLNRASAPSGETNEMKKIILAAALLLTGAATASAQDAEAGKAVFSKCGVCHKIGEGAANGLGPMLTCVVGRKAGSVEGYTYSAAVTAAGAGGWIWTEEKLGEWVQAASKVIPGTKMLFPAGVKDETDRANLIAYLKSECPAPK
jgi:cytochrome c